MEQRCPSTVLVCPRIRPVFPAPPALPARRGRTRGAMGWCEPPAPGARAPHVSPGHLSPPSTALGIAEFALPPRCADGETEAGGNVSFPSPACASPSPCVAGEGGVSGNTTHTPKKWVWPVTASRPQQGEEERCRRRAPALPNPPTLPPPSSSSTCCWGCAGGLAPHGNPPHCGEGRQRRRWGSSGPGRCCSSHRWVRFRSGSSPLDRCGRGG